MRTINSVCPAFEDWPRRWCGSREDIPYGERLRDLFAPFIQSLIDQGLTDTTIARHCFNLWLLGGEIIRGVSMHNKYKIHPHAMLLASIGPDGGLWCEHLHTERDMNSYDATCKKLYEFLQGTQGMANQAL